MAITLNRAVVHELIKEKNIDPSPLHFRPSLLPTDNENVRNVIEGVVGIYGRRNNSARYGIFTNEAAYNTPNAFSRYSALDDGTIDECFMDFSQTVMRELYREATGVSFATGGHILFADYESEGIRFFLAAMIKQKAGFAFSNALGVENLEYIDLSKLHQAIKINFDKYNAYQEAEEVDKLELTYLSFVSPQASQSTAGYFINAMGCKAGAHSAKATEAVIKESVNFFESKEELKQNAHDIKRDICVYLAEKAEVNESATLADIEGLARNYFPTETEEQADDFADEFVTHLNSEEVGVPPEFPVNRQKLKKLTHLIYKGNDLRLEFEKNDLGNDPTARVYFDGTQIIIKNLPDDLVEKLNDQING
ncbi:nucleoid-associated protein [Pseudoalteromonas sp. NZS71_1]|uniref:nucleoid-associated protein n=1 Tax=Pseudoalteromonas sp. NZS71_1 TaxID=2792072 RepID=UPI0018CD1F79|nr:nucleoid-associated protein [Pseudoalteromonas sp. NZS71_1]MBH0034603.1 nucleoid-associated protein [Pseudoalteromonas sp. NZS71_1]